MISSRPSAKPVRPVRLKRPDQRWFVETNASARQISIGREAHLGESVAQLAEHRPCGDNTNGCVAGCSADLVESVGGNKRFGSFEPGAKHFSFRAHGMWCDQRDALGVAERFVIDLEVGHDDRDSFGIGVDGGVGISDIAVDLETNP